MSSVSSASSENGDARSHGANRGEPSAETSESYGVYRDPWGIPHLRASDELRLVHAQGRVTAFDRAWQLEVERHRSEGSSASFLGADAVTWDRFARQSRLADTARPLLTAMEADDPATAAWVRAYVDGRQRRARRRRRPSATLRAPARPHPAGSRGCRWLIWIATHILFAGFATKLWRERVARALGDEAVTPLPPPTAPARPAATAGWSRATAPPPDRRSSRATRTGSSRTRASTSRYVSPVPDLRRRWASPSPASPASATSGTPAPPPGRSPTRCPTTRTCTSSGCAVRTTAPYGPSARTASGSPSPATPRPSPWPTATTSRWRSWRPRAAR